MWKCQKGYWRFMDKIVTGYMVAGLRVINPVIIEATYM
jgi:hypothetical protein